MPDKGDCLHCAIIVRIARWLTENPSAGGTQVLIGQAHAFGEAIAAIEDPQHRAGVLAVMIEKLPGFVEMCCQDKREKVPCNVGVMGRA